MEQNSHKRRNISRRTVIIATAIIVAAAAVLVFFWQESRKNDPNETIGDYRQRRQYQKVIEVDGVQYFQRESVTTMLVIGVDTTGVINTADGGHDYRVGGQADFLQLLAFDHTNHTITQIPISRDTWTKIRVLGYFGDTAGIREEHISLSHSFGDGGEQSAKLTQEAVSNLFQGIKIDFVLAMNMDGIPIVNDSVGGVTVQLEDDFSAYDPTWVPGATVTLHGKEAEIFCRTRMTVSDGSNDSRMRRQEVYISAFAKRLMEEVKKDTDFIGRVYDSLTPYLVSNISRKNLVNLAYSVRNYERRTVNIPGKPDVDYQGFPIVRVDRKALREICLDTFFTTMDSSTQSTTGAEADV